VARDADVALRHYAGHAMQFGGVTYLFPVDAVLRDEADLRRLIRVDDLMSDLDQAKSLRILVLDSCRDNPLADELNRSLKAVRGVTIDRGLARMVAPRGMMIPYAKQLGRISIEDWCRFSEYRCGCIRCDARRQFPELTLSLITDDYLNGLPPPATLAAQCDPAASAWEAVKGTKSPEVLNAFIQRFDNTICATLARARLDELKRPGEKTR
jgi:caspase domain-containing protein